MAQPLLYPLTNLRLRTHNEQGKTDRVGNGMVGHHFLEHLAETGLAKDFAVTVIGEEKQIAYDRVELTSNE